MSYLLSSSQSMNVNEYAQQTAQGPTTSIPSSHSYSTPPNPSLPRPGAFQTSSTNMMASTSSAASSSFSPVPVAVPNPYYASQQQQHHYSTQTLSSYPHPPVVHTHPTMQQPFHQQHHPYPPQHPLPVSMKSNPNMASYGYQPPPQHLYPSPSPHPPQPQSFPPSTGITTKPGPGPGIAPLFPRTLSSSSSYSATSTSASAPLPSGVPGTGNSSELVSPASALSEPSVRTPASADGLGFPPAPHGPSSTSAYSSVHVGGVGGHGHAYQHQSHVGPYAQTNPVLPSPHVIVTQQSNPAMMVPGGGGNSQSNMVFGTGGMGPPLLQEQFTGKTIHTAEDMHEYRRMLSVAQRHGQMHSFDPSIGAGGGPPGPAGARSRSGSAMGSGMYWNFCFYLMQEPERERPTDDLSNYFPFPFFFF